MTRRLLHLVNAHSTNIGNGALIEGLERVVSEDAREPIAWRREAWDDYTFELKAFDRAFVDLVNGHDALIVNGAVAINGRAYLRHAGMRFDLPAQLWDEIKRPIVFYGLSYRHWRGQPFHHLDKFKEAVARISASPRMILGVRNDGTRAWLRDTMGIDVSRIVEVPDTAVFVPFDPSARASELEPQRVNVIVALNDEDSPQRYAEPGSRERVLRGVAGTLSRLLSRHDMNIVLAPHYFDDHRMIADLIEMCPPRLAHQRMISSGLARVANTREFYGRYARADLVIAMRVHSMSPAIGLGVPMVPLVTQDRMVDFLADVGLADLAVDALAPDLEARLTTAAEATLADPASIRRRFSAAREGMRTRLAEFNRRVAGLLDSGRAA